jgi:hypothetical protein
MPTYIVEYSDTDGKRRTKEVTAAQEELIPFFLKKRDKRFKRVVNISTKQDLTNHPITHHA